MCLSYISVLLAFVSNKMILVKKVTVANVYKYLTKHFDDLFLFLRKENNVLLGALYLAEVRHTYALIYEMK